MYFQILFIIGAVFGDIYLHNPRGSNNRCDERTNDRTNANRLFDSQNNGAGGYAVPCQDTDLMCFPMNFYTGSYLDLRFTTQHACGIQNQCEIVIQYGCNMRDGAPLNAAGNTCTGTMPDNNLTLDHPRYGYHETYESYQACKARPRNGNLYTGDQVLRGSSAIYTRQNPNGQRYGFECPEERDYYPYWGPSVWQDIAVMTSDLTLCPANISCLPINHTMVNRLGATYAGTSESSFLWRLPGEPAENCVLRIRYNISLPTDLNPYADKRNNTAFTTDPFINVNGRYVRLALDTAQLPRTFEDRSYVFNILQRPVEPSVPIYNINVQGKRGNIAQVRNCFEYDFVPNNLTITADLDYLHFQWVGSDFNPLGNDGEGRAGTDRSNMVEIQDFTGFNRIILQGGGTFLPPDLMDQFLYLNQSHCFSPEQLKLANTQDLRHCALLNNASVYFNSRLFVIKVNGTYYYMSTRNNNFSNRNQKGVIIVNPKPVSTSTPHPGSTSTPHPGSTSKTSSTDFLAEDASATGSTLAAGYIVLIIACILLVICSFIYVKRNYNFFKKKKKEITRSFAAKI